MPADDSADGFRTVTRTPGLALEAPSNDRADGSTGTAAHSGSTPRGRLALALGEAVRAGLETGDDSLVALAARTLAELLRTEG